MIRSQLAKIRPVIQYDLAGNFIRQWQNYYEAANHYGVSLKAISNAVVNKHCSAGFQWRKIKKGEDIKPIDPFCNNGIRTVYQISKDNKIIKEYPSTTSASKQTGIDRASINKTALGQRRTAGGFIWSYEARELGYLK